MRRRGQLEDASGGYSSALVLVPYNDRIQNFMQKHGDKAVDELWKEENEKEVSTFYRLTQDLRELNQKTVADLYPLPRIDYLLDQVRLGTTHFSIADLMDAFWCVPLAKEDRHKTAFRTPYDHVQSTVMVQGGKNSANMWARVAAMTFSVMASDEAIVYQDDVLGQSRTFEEHYGVLNKLYDCLDKSGLTFKLAKCHFDYPEIEFLGHCIDKNGRYPSKKAVEAIVELAYPCEDQTAVRSFVGMTLYYKDYIHGYADIVAPLHALTKKGVEVKARWGEEHRIAVDRLKQALTEAPCLQTVDNTKAFQIRVDACRKGRGLGAVLLQPSVQDETKWVPVAYWSKGLRPAERDYSPTELECKSLHDCILHWDVYLQCARVFDVFTDHNALQYMVRGQTATNNGRLMRYLMDIQGYTFNLHYKEGRYHLDADGVSRLLRKGETPVYWTADDLEDDKGVPTEEDILWARDQDEKKNRRKEAMMQRKVKKTEAEQMDIMEKMLQSSGDVEEIVKEDRRMKKEIKQQKKLLETLIEQTDKLASLGADTETHPEELAQRCAHSAAQVGGRRKPGDTVETLGWMQKLRGRNKSVRYAMEAQPQAWRDDVDTASKSEVEQTLEDKKRAGYSRLRVLPSSIQGAGNGLYSRYLIKDQGYICDYSGREVNQEELDSEGYDTTYVFSSMRNGKWTHVDANQADSCFGRFANDPRDETKTNAKIVRRGKKLALIATTDILPGEEIYIDYGYEYWLDRMQHLRPEQQEAVRRAARKVAETRGEESKTPMVDSPKQVSMVASPMKGPSVKDAIADVSNKAERATRVQFAARKLTEEQQDRYVFDNVFQCPELAEDLQYLVGRRYVDDENGVLYQVDKVEYSESAKAVVGYRRAMDGRLYKYDDDPFHVYGAMGLLQLTELYEIDREEDVVKWPTDAREWSEVQEADDHLKELRSLAKGEGGKEWQSGRDTYRVWEIDRSEVLFRKNVAKGRVSWQKMVPRVLQEKVMKMFHEGYGHPGATRALETLRLHYYWEGQREEFTAHCRECLSCQLRNAYTRKPKTPVQAYPDALEPMWRIHIDLTGPLVATINGNEYILVVKDYLTRYVWLFAIPDKSAERIAQILFEQVISPFGPPQMLVSDRGKEFTNKINKRLSQLFRINRVSTTPYNPRANGMVEQHNGTLKSQLHHFVDVRQSDWDRFLPTVQMMYNSIVCPSTGYTPNYMMFGRESTTPDIVVPDDNPVNEDRDEAWIEKLSKALGIAWDVALMKARTRAGNTRKGLLAPTMADINRESSSGDTRGRQPQYKEYQVGDKFFRRRNPVRTFRSASDKETYKISLKLQARYEGPYRVKRRVNAVVFVTEIGGEEVRVHAINMKPAVG